MVFIALDISKEMFLFSFQSNEKIKVMHIWPTSSMPLKFNIVNLLQKDFKVRNSMDRTLKHQIMLEYARSNIESIPPHEE